ncbi:MULTISPECIES: DNA-processing protein DprA [Staphylococcus]|nr:MULTISPECIES: DNA-processing protein DprA [Staphylococcus]MCH4392412.1 DNA-processing protein DprA [Staphylococcus haemolyticus]MCI2950326.1 DNA-processing protein DprA [Staphylococcus haemolyticus]OHR78200.1 DNA processing protein DprA [Staphylococcus sp. HMSC34B12]WEB17478.1 DNA-processing protein DprA [Staphylococcus haemolyticus]
MTNNNILLLKLIWLGYTTQHIHHLLKLNPDFFKFSYTDQIDTIRNWDRMFHNDDFIDKFNNLNEKDILSFLQNHKVSFTTPFNTNYPRQLKEIYDYPFVLFYQGDPLLLTFSNTLGVVGSRNATEYSAKAMQYLFPKFKQIPLTIISGLAKGADSIAHHFAIEYQLPTIAVLGFGHMMHYPRETQKLRNIIEEKGLVISEYPPLTSVRRYHFPQRNRLISGLSKGVLITEASVRSGSQITIDCALEQNRNIYVLPGSIFNPLTKGNLKRAQEGAMIVTSADDILCDYK